MEVAEMQEKVNQLCSKIKYCFDCPLNEMCYNSDEELNRVWVPSLDGCDWSKEDCEKAMEIIENEEKTMATVISTGYMIYRPDMHTKYHGPQWGDRCIYKDRGTAERYANGGKVVPVQIVVKEEDDGKHN